MAEAIENTPRYAPTTPTHTFWGHLKPGSERFIKRTYAVSLHRRYTLLPNVCDNASTQPTSRPPESLAVSETYHLTPAYLFNLISLHSTPAYLAPVPLVWILFQKHAKLIPISSSLLFLLLGIPLPQIFA